MATKFPPMARSSREEACRKAARDLLALLMIRHPSEIDLQALAFKAGGLVIEEGGLETADGRIVSAPGKGGSIRVKAGLPPGRKRFTIAHEIGHAVLHPLIAHSAEHSSRDFTIWNDSSEESDANVFAAELLMPDFLFKVRCRGKTPSLAVIDVLSSEFQTSFMATAFQYIQYTNEQVALVVSKDDRIQFVRRSADFWPLVRHGTISPDSAAGERLAGKGPDSNRMVRSPAYAWLPKFEHDTSHDIMEDSRLLEYYERTVTLLWMKDDLSDGS